MTHKNGVCTRFQGGVGKVFGNISVVYSTSLCLGTDKVEPVILTPVSYTHLRAHETGRNLVCRLLLEKKNLAQRLINLEISVLVRSLKSSNVELG